MEKENKSNSIHIMVVEPRGTGGMIHYAYQLCTALSNAGANVTLVTSSVYELDDMAHNFKLRKQMRLWSTIESQNIETSFGVVGSVTQTVYRKVRRIIRGIRLIFEWIRLVIFLIRAKPDIVQFGKIEFAFEAFFLSILKNRVTTSQICHEFELREQGNNIFVNIANKLYRWVYDTFSIIFFHGESNKTRFLSLFHTPKEKLYNIEHGNEDLFLTKQSIEFTGETLRLRYGIPSGQPVVLFFGNLMPSKGIPDLLEAFARVYKKNTNVSLVIAGNPSKFIDINSLKQLSSDLNIHTAAIFDARYILSEEVPALMELATVVVYPYLNSTQSGALQVAYTFGKPVIATNVGGLPEVVESGKSGIIVPPASPKKLADAIEQVINNPKLAQEMGSYAKHLSKTRFSWDNIATKILVIYKDHLDNKSPA